VKGTQRRKQFLAPEVLQVSAMDCGPACLASALAGHGLQHGYESIRDACRTDVDGTSIDSLESVANRHGLVAEQVWVPLDHLTIPEVSPFPAICVTQVPGGVSHFVLAWRRVGGLLQMMDPGAGRRWLGISEFAGLQYLYQLEIDAEVWRSWAETPEFTLAMRVRLAAVGASTDFLERAQADSSPISLSCLDAATRMVRELIDAGGVRPGKEARELVRSLHELAQRDVRQGDPGRTIPERLYSALPTSTAAARVRLSGAILLRFRGIDGATVSLSRRLRLGWRPWTREGRRPTRSGPWIYAMKTLLADGARGSVLVLGSLTVAAGLLVFEGLMLRSVAEIGGIVEQPTQRALFLCAFLGLLILGCRMDLWRMHELLAMGRRLEVRLRMQLLELIPRLDDEYFRSRPSSDLAHRAHVFHSVRELPAMVERMLRLAVQLIVTVGALCWIDPASWKLVLAVAICALLLPWLGQGRLQATDWKVRVQDGKLAQFNLDAFLGVMPIRAHGAERAVRCQHRSIVREWVRARRQHLRASLWVEMGQLLATTAFAVALILGYVERTEHAGGILLVAYWTLSLPIVGLQMAVLARQLPREHSVLARIMEPMQLQSGTRSASNDAGAAPGSDAHASRCDARDSNALSIDFDQVYVEVADRRIIDGVSLSIAAGTHVAIVGPSGAGKTSLLGLLLGWSAPSSGAVRVDGALFDPSQLRPQIAWVDPAVTLWGRSMLDNLRYGSETKALPTGLILEQADLLDVLERMPAGLQTPLGEGGRLVSGGEGQRVRLGRAMARHDARLVLLDEPFRGLEAANREHLMQRARSLWRHSTVLCVTHDLESARQFDRVIVLERGRVVEDGHPQQCEQASGRFAELLEAERRVRRIGWRDPSWRKVRVHRGAVRDSLEIAS